MFVHCGVKFSWVRAILLSPRFGKFGKDAVSSVGDLHTCFSRELFGGIVKDLPKTILKLTRPNMRL
tara:strand:- start:30 stop:227 length:198 start_codon:yes stop_codon:yes gene_type:complete